MNKTIIHQALTALLPEMIKRGSASDVLLEYAREHNLAPAQLEKMAQEFNVAKTLHFIKKADNPGDSFAVMDPQDLVRRYARADDFATALDKAASTKGPTTIHARFTPGVLLGEYLEKAATALEPEGMSVDEAVTVFERALDRIASDKEDFRHAFRGASKKACLMFDGLLEDERDEFYADTRYVFGKEAAESAFDLVLGAKAKDRPEADDDQLAKLAFDMSLRTSEPRRARLDILAKAFAAHAGFQKLAAYELEAEELASEYLKKNASTLGTDPRPKRLRDLQSAKDRGEAHRRLQRTGYEADLAEEEAVARAERSRGRELARSFDNMDPLSEELQWRPEMEALLAGTDDVLGKHVNPFLHGLPGIGKPMGLLRDTAEGFRPSRNDTRLAVDRARDETESLTSFIRLIHTDPILSEADPEKLTEVYNTLRSVNPEFVMEPARLRLALREAAQYDGAVPAHAIAELANVRKTLSDARGKERMAEQEDYSVSAPRGFPGGSQASRRENPPSGQDRGRRDVR